MSANEEQAKSALGERIRTIRKEKGMTQEELGQIIGVVKSNIARYESGKLEITYTMLGRIANALEVPVYKLVLMMNDEEAGNMESSDSLKDTISQEVVVKEEDSQIGEKLIIHRVETFSSRLQTALKTAGKKRSELCQEIGISEPALCNYLNGKHMPKPELMSKLACVLNVSEGWLNGYECDSAVGMNDSVNSIIKTAQEEILQILHRMATDPDFLNTIGKINKLDQERFLSLKNLILVFDK